MDGFQDRRLQCFSCACAPQPVRNDYFILSGSETGGEGFAHGVQFKDGHVYLKSAEPVVRVFVVFGVGPPNRVAISQT